MNTTQTLEQMKQLRLLGMHQSYNAQLELPMDKQLDSHELIASLLQAEMLNRANEKTAYYVKLAKLRLPATMEQIECSAARNLTKAQLSLLAEGRYLNQGENILITGATGCGKSFLACALGHQACLQGYKTIYLNLNRLIEKVTLSKLDGSYIKFLNHLERQTLIILDDFGLAPMTRDNYLLIVFYQINIENPGLPLLHTTYLPDPGLSSSFTPNSEGLSPIYNTSSPPFMISA